MREIVDREHQFTHWSAEKSLKHLRKTMIGSKMTEIVYPKTQKCGRCKRNNPNTENRVVIGTIKSSHSPGDYWQIDFTELPYMKRAINIF